MGSEAPNEYGTFIIDSAANPTFLCRPPKNIETPTGPAIVNTANGHVRSDKKYPATIWTENQTRFQIYTYVFPGLEDNLLAISDIIKCQGPIVFTKTGVYPIPEQVLKVIKPGKCIASYKDGAYSTKATIHRRQHKDSTNTHNIWHKNDNAARISSIRRPKKKAISNNRK